MQCAGQLFLALTGQVDAGAAGQQAADGGGGVPPGDTGDVQPYGRHPARKSLLQPCSLLQKPPLHLLRLINRRAAAPLWVQPCPAHSGRHGRTPSGALALAAPEGPPLQECLQRSTVAMHKLGLKLGGATCTLLLEGNSHCSSLSSAGTTTAVHACMQLDSHGDAPLQKCRGVGQALCVVGLQQVADHPSSLLVGKGATGVDIQQQLAGAQDRQHC